VHRTVSEIRGDDGWSLRSYCVSGSAVKTSKQLFVSLKCPLYYIKISFSFVRPMNEQVIHCWSLIPPVSMLWDCSVCMGRSVVVVIVEAYDKDKQGAERFIDGIELKRLVRRRSACTLLWEKRKARRSRDTDSFSKGRWVTSCAADSVQRTMTTNQ